MTTKFHEYVHIYRTENIKILLSEPMTTKFYEYFYINDAYQLTIMGYEGAYMIISIGLFLFVCLSP